MGVETEINLGLYLRAGLRLIFILISGPGLILGLIVSLGLGLRLVSVLTLGKNIMKMIKAANSITGTTLSVPKSSTDASSSSTETQAFGGTRYLSINTSLIKSLSWEYDQIRSKQK